MEEAVARASKVTGELHETFQVAVLGKAAKPIGSGLILDDRHVLTCTHVAAQATTGRIDAAPLSDIDIHLRTIPWSGDEPIVGRLRADAWRSTIGVPGDRGVRDLAVLKLSFPLPGRQACYGIYPGNWMPRDEMPLFAFPDKMSEGIRSKIVMMGGLADYWIQLDAAPNAQYRVQPGFSGSPLFDPNSGAVRGLVAAADLGEGRTGFLIPGRAILEFLDTIPDLRTLADRLRARAPLHNAPELPAKLTRRSSLVDAIKTDLKHQSTSVGLRGMGGIGKSVAARLLAEDDWVRSEYLDGIEWITVGENKNQQDIEALQAGLLSRLGGRLERDQSLDGIRQAIDSELAHRRMLFIVDDVWTPLAVRAFQLRADRCAVVYTSRKRTGFDACGVTVRDVELLSETEADELFRMHANLPAIGHISVTARAILSRCKRHALAITIAGSMLAQYPTEAELILDRFDRANVEEIVASVPDYRRSQAFPDQETSIFRIMAVSADFLKDSERDFLARLAIFPEDTPIPFAAIEILAAGNSLDRIKLKQIIDRLDDAALLTFHADRALPARSTVTMHDLQRAFVSFLNKAPEADHRALVNGVEDRFGGRLFAEDKLAGANYFRRNMVRHLIGAGRQEDLFGLLIDPDWIAHRLRAGDQVFELVADYDRAFASEPQP